MSWMATGAMTLMLPCEEAVWVAEGYHGTVDKTLITLEAGTARVRRGNVGPPVDPSLATKVVELKQDVDVGGIGGLLTEKAFTHMTWIASC